MAENPTVEQADGTLQRRGPQFGGFLEAINSQEPLAAGSQGWVDDFAAVQLGLYQILVNLTFTTVDRVALVSQGRVERNSFQLQSVFLDFAEPENERIPTPTAAIMQSSATVMDNPYGLVSQELLDDTLNVFAPDTVLQKLYEADYRLAVVVWLATKDDRAAVRKRVVEVMGVEPDSDLPGRRIALPWYFERTCRYNIERVEYPDTPDLAMSQTWPLVVEFSARVPAVQLVEAPPCIRIPPSAVDVT